MFHVANNAIIATQTQAKSCDNRFCYPDADARNGRMSQKTLTERIIALDLKQIEIANFLGIAPDKVSKTMSGIRQWSGPEVAKLTPWVTDHEQGRIPQADLPTVEGNRDYLSIEILPSFAGMGGGGTGEGDVEMGMVPRRLIEDELRAKPSDVLLIEARGDSMMPDFHHGDQILIDRRDVNPIQPGSFALWDGDGYVVKIVERLPQKQGWYRIFSSNGRYQSSEVDSVSVMIMGRPVWFARRL